MLSLPLLAGVDPLFLSVVGVEQASSKMPVLLGCIFLDLWLWRTGSPGGLFICSVQVTRFSPGSHTRPPGHEPHVPPQLLGSLANLPASLHSSGFCLFI